MSKILLQRGPTLNVKFHFRFPFCFLEPFPKSYVVPCRLHLRSSLVWQIYAVFIPFCKKNIYFFHTGKMNQSQKYLSLNFRLYAWTIQQLFNSIKLNTIPWCWKLCIHLNLLWSEKSEMSCTWSRSQKTWPNWMLLGRSLRLRGRFPFTAFIRNRIQIL